ncbi:LmbE family N-acetylglucosaminyl deacetylase [Kibdelosporangium banguiense]|uniref:LmbE family N-acetylglucosaminyl deacetylase n=1 Tax=Kibdelosporangium banguiense TaxID=1365924 RepID=A0ABS4TQU5_9PSEU|nr:PIG-L family deacetylase [Kibdelosporangium banguiense]MBP2326246.1 LmbE family N-acetylglucosaminyl deacetylase [Kibdelosporangium banguiense]
MATMVTFHAHPDDECITCGGVMRKAYEDGHRVVLVVATKGELGEVPESLDEPLWQLRVRETHASAEILGAARVEFLGYTDSGMMGDSSNQTPGNFWTASIEEAAQRLAAILAEENADVLTIYDDHGTYGHPDHIQVHRVGKRAAEIAGTPRVYQQTANRTVAQAAENPPPVVMDPNFGSPAEKITAAVDVTKFAYAKRQAMRAHASQISEDSYFLGMPDEVFEVAFGTEWFIRDGQGPGITETDLMEGLDV